MARIRNLVIGTAVGAAVAYFFDPEQGGARRAKLQEQLSATARRGTRSLEGTVRRLQEGVQGAMGAMPQLESGETRPADDLTVLNRVESALFARPGFRRGSVNVEVADGQVTLRGQPASEEEARELVRAAEGVPGVTAVESLLLVTGTPPPGRSAARRAGA